MSFGIEPDIFISTTWQDDHGDAGIFLRGGLVDEVGGGGDIAVNAAGACRGVGMGVIIGAHNVLPVVVADRVVLYAIGP